MGLNWKWKSLGHVWLFASPWTILLLLLLSRFIVSDSVWPHRRQPTRLSRPWDSPGKNTGVGCHFLLHSMKVKSQSEVAQSGLTPGQNTGVGCHSLLQGIFPTKGLNPGVPHCRQILYQLSHQGSKWNVYCYIHM